MTDDEKPKLADIGLKWRAGKLRSLRQGDQDAQESFVRDTGPFVLSMLRRYLVCPEDIKDCFQETFLNAFRNFDQFRGDSAVTTWLMSIARNCALARLRKNSAKVEIRPEGESEEKYDEFGFRVFPANLSIPDVEKILESLDNQREVRKAISELSDTYRTVILLKDFEGLTLLEIAKTLNISVPAAKVRVHRARRELRRKLNWIFETDDDL